MDERQEVIDNLIIAKEHLDLWSPFYEKDVLEGIDKAIALLMEFVNVCCFDGKICREPGCSRCGKVEGNG